MDSGAKVLASFMETCALADHGHGDQAPMEHTMGMPSGDCAAALPVSVHGPLTGCTP
jgi:hypothetical protein